MVKKQRVKNMKTQSQSQNQRQINPTGQNIGSIYGILGFMNDHIMYLNNSKFFAGIIMIMLNIGSKFISIQFSKSTEEYLKYSVTKQLLVFAMAWMGTRDIYTALILTAVFTVLSDHLFNEESRLCVVPHKYRVLHKLIDTNDDGVVSDSDIAAAVSVLDKAKREKEIKQQKDALTKFDLLKSDYSAVPPTNN